MNEILINELKSHYIFFNKSLQPVKHNQNNLAKYLIILAISPETDRHRLPERDESHWATTWLGERKMSS